MDQMQPGTFSDRKPVYLLDADRIDLYWENMKPLLESLPVFSDLYPPEWVYSEAKMGRLQIWALADDQIRAIVLTRISEYPRARVFEILGVAGQRAYNFVSEMEAMFEWVAREQDCTWFKATVREGVTRKLRNVNGIRYMGTMLMKKIIPSRAN